MTRYLGKYTVDKDGTVHWYNEKHELHREDGPAIEYVNGDKFWYMNGKLHNSDGPAIIYSNGEEHWYEHGNFIRSEGSNPWTYKK